MLYKGAHFSRNSNECKCQILSLDKTKLLLAETKQIILLTG